MASDAELVSVRVSKVGAIVVLVVFRPRTRRSFRGATAGKCDFVRLIDDGSARREEGDHLAVTGVVRLPIVRPADEKQWPWIRM
jgi:hypothetical protein